ncbi:MAG: hypothetical protein ACN6QT_36575, partial [Burkholderia contaminans]
MIKTISIRNYKSFHPTTPTVIQIDTSTDKPVIFYGLNGAVPRVKQDESRASIRMRVMALRQRW